MQWTNDALALLVNKVRERLDKLKLSQIPNDAGFITAAQAPVQSVNGATGAVNTRAYDFSFVGTSDFAAQVDTALATHSAGSYTFVIPSGSANGMPSNTYWYGIIQCTSANYAQVICWGNTGSYNTYRRYKSNGAWGSWIKLVDEEALYYESGDTFSITTGTLPGLVFYSTKRVKFLVPTPKSLENISSIAVTALTGWIAGINGAVENNTSSTYSWTSSTYTTTASKVSNNLVQIVIEKSTAFSNATNVTPANMSIGSLTLTFS